MFIRKDNSLYNFYVSNIQVDPPVKANFADFTVKPYQSTGYYSGSYLMAQYFMSQYFCAKDYKIDMTDDLIIEQFYNTVTKERNYISFADGLNDVAYRLASYAGDQKGDVILFKDVELIKHFIHKFCTIAIELKSDLAFCNYDKNNLNNVFICPQLTGKYLDENLTKGFIACGYDSEYILLQNSLGEKFGSSGFMKMSWAQLKTSLVKAGCIKNVY